MQSIAKNQEKNMDKTTEERDQLAKVQSAAVSSFCERVFMLVSRVSPSFLCSHLSGSSPTKLSIENIDNANVMKRESE